MLREGYNDELFKITCLKCGSDECSIIEHELNDSEDEVIGLSWHVHCHQCQNWDI